MHARTMAYTRTTRQLLRSKRDSYTAHMTTTTLSRKIIAKGRSHVTVNLMIAACVLSLGRRMYPSFGFDLAREPILAKTRNTKQRIPRAELQQRKGNYRRTRVEFTGQS